MSPQDPSTRPNDFYPMTERSNPATLTSAPATRPLAGASRLRSWSRLLRGKAPSKADPSDLTDLQRFQNHRGRLGEFTLVFDQIVARIVELDEGAPEIVQDRLRAETRALAALKDVLAKEEAAFRAFQSSLSGQSTLFLSKWRMSDEEILFVEAQSLCGVYEALAQDIKRQQVAISARLIEFPKD